MVYRFEDFELDTALYELRRSGELVPVEPQVFALLALLVSNHGRVLTTRSMPRSGTIAWSPKRR